ncbi:MAG: glycosyltransferase family 4 protein [Phycisphaerales bacterium]|nr:MAG: glycosyltransferase family 4 protein [Phycisphaerales bacterium]
MKIAFSARGLSVSSGGARQFIKSLVPALAECRGSDELIFMYDRRRFCGLASDCQEIAMECRNKIWWDFVYFPRMLRKLKVDAAIFPKNVIPFFTNCACYVVIHDLAYFVSGLNAYPFLDTLYMRSLIPRSVRRAAGVFAVSRNTEQDIIRYTGCDSKKITVTYEAADKCYRHIDDPESLKTVKRKYEVPDRFVLYTGSLSPRKNLVRLLEAFGKMRGRIPHNLALTGSKSWKDRSVHETIQRLGLRDTVKRLGYVEEQDMPALYNLASAYVYPSLYEGFGLPVLEAMQCGCPVVASNATSIPEVAGDAAMLFDPCDTGAIAEALYKILTDEIAREQLIASGFRQAAKYSWRRCAETMLTAVRQAKGGD